MYRGEGRLLGNIMVTRSSKMEEAYILRHVVLNSFDSKAVVITKGTIKIIFCGNWELITGIEKKLVWVNTLLNIQTGML